MLNAEHAGFSEPGTAFPAYSVRGEFALEGQTLQGWCWSPERPSERLRVVVERDGQPMAAAVAARLRLDLVREGVCDGYHAFVFHLPDDARGFAVLEAREVTTRQVFGRILGGGASDLMRWRAQIDGLAGQMADLHTALNGCANLETLLPSAFAELAAPISPSAEPRHFPPALRLPFVATPRVSLIIDAVTDPSSALSAVATLAPLLRAQAAELIIVDGGNTEFSAAFASLSGLRLCLTARAGRAERLNAAAAQGRGTFLLVLAADQIDVSAVLRLPLCAETVLIGHHVTMAAESAGELGLAPSEMCLPGVLLFTSQAVFTAQRGLDPQMDDGLWLSEVDFALRAREAGVAIAAMGGGIAYGPPSGLPDMAARAKFKSRWGRAANFVKSA